MSTTSSAPSGDDRAEDAASGAAGSAPETVSEEDKARAGAALRASFARLSPQGSDEWNFMGAFTHLGDRYGPYQPGASDLADLLRSGSTGTSARRGRKGRPPAGDAEGDKSEVGDAMTHVVEAFRFLHARVSTLETRLGTEDAPLDGAAWLAPARELGGWVEPVAVLVLAHTPGGEILHADCGEGALVRVLSDRGAPAHGVEPRGGVALRALERGCDVTISEVGEYLAQRPADSLGGLVLSGVVDRLALHAIVPLLADARRALAPGAPIVIVSEPVAPTHAATPVSQDMVDGADLHAETWVLLLSRSGFVDVAPLSTGAERDDRFGLSAGVPTT